MPSFQSPLPRRKAPIDGTATWTDGEFQSSLSREKRLRRGAVHCAFARFQSPLPREKRREIQGVLKCIEYISIPASAREAPALKAAFKPGSIFQSPLPRRKRPAGCTAKAPRRYFNPRFRAGSAITLSSHLPKHSIHIIQIPAHLPIFPLSVPSLSAFSAVQTLPASLVLSRFAPLRCVSSPRPSAALAPRKKLLTRRQSACISGRERRFRRRTRAAFRPFPPRFAPSGVPSPPNTGRSGSYAPTRSA